VKLGEFRKMTSHLGDEAKMFIHNEDCEWYGTQEMDPEAWSTDGGDVTFDFCNFKDEEVNDGQREAG
jgi:hypothetical protein